MQLNNTEKPCLIVVIIAKTNGPKVAIVLKINNCPAAEHTDSNKQSIIKDGYCNIKLIDDTNPPCCSKETAVKIHEKKFTAHIICTGFIPYCLNNAPCQLDVKLSKAIYEHRSITPENVVTVDPLRSFSVSSMKNSIPIDSTTADTYS